MCIIDDKNKIIFVAIPKTGTTSVEYYFNEILKIDNKMKKYGLKKHSTARQIKKKVKNYDEYFKFAIIRNPYDWYVSWYTYRKRKNSNFATNNMSFEDYLKKMPMQKIINYIIDENSNLIVDKIIKFEDDINIEIKKLLKERSINIENNFVHKNKSFNRKNRKYSEYYNDNTKKFVGEFQKDIIKLFDYKF